MNWEAIGAIGEIVGALAVVATLVYLSLQIRENTKSNRVNARQNFINQLASFMDDFVKDPELSDLHRRGCEDLDSLSEEELARWESLIRKSFIYMSSQHYQNHIGTMDDETWHEVRIYSDFYASRPGIWQWWPPNRGSFGRSFRHYMDDAIEAAMERKC